MLNTNDSQWWEKRVLRSVDYLKLWKENPRFDSSESQSRIKVADFVDEITNNNADKMAFQALIKSIVQHGYKEFEPIVVWKNESGQYSVAEGNRRILALKLLRNPDKAPKAFRDFVLQQSKLVNRNEIDKVKVCVAPSFKDCRWYILQRHSTSSIQRPWQRLEQQRFIVSLYDEYNHDIDLVIKETNFSRSQINQALRYVHLRDLATRNEITDLMTEEEKALIYGNRISMTILERWFSSEKIRDHWGIQFDGNTVKITSDEKSFLNAYGHFLKLMFDREASTLGLQVNTRTIPARNDDILAALPKVTFSSDRTPKEVPLKNNEKNIETHKDDNSSTKKKTHDLTDKQKEKEPQLTIKNQVRHTSNRLRVVAQGSTITVQSAKLNSLFGELKEIPVTKYIYSVSITLRVFLDLSVDDYIKRHKLDQLIAKELRTGYNQTTLQRRLKFINDQHVKDTQANKTISKLLQSNNEHSLDTLNNFIHGHDTHKIDQKFINNFWDMLAPLLSVLIDLKEK